MPSNYSRRRFLSVLSVGSLSLSGGCAGNLLDSRRLAHQVEVFNYTHETHNLYVDVENDSGKTLFQEMYRLKVGKGNETSKPFGGAPSKVRITVDGNRPKTYEWPQPNCEERGMKSAGGIRVTILRDDTINVSGSCDTVTTS